MFDTLDACINAWKLAGNHGSKQERIERNFRWKRYYAYLNVFQLDAEANIDPHAANVVDLLFQQGLLTQTSSVLDIGSGIGTYSLAFANQCAEVTALEMDATSLAALRTSAKQLGLSNITYVEDMWETFSPQRKHSFVYCSMCPAICDYDELLRMETLSEHSCGIVAVTRGSYDLHRKRMMQLLDIHPTAGMTTEALWYYEALYLAGKQPNVQSWSRQYEYTFSIKDACLRNERYFEIFGVAPETSRPILLEYFSSVAKDGLVHDKTLLNTALITWQV